MKNVVILLMSVLLIVSCSQSATQGEVPERPMNNKQLRVALEELNGRIMERIGLDPTRGNELTTTDTTKVVVADVTGAAKGAYDGYKVGGPWGAVIGAVVEGALASYLASNEIYVGSTTTDGATSDVLQYDNYLRICDAVLSANTTLMSAFQTDNVSQAQQLVGIIHNSVLDSLYKCEAEGVNCNEDLLVIDSCYVNSLRPCFEVFLYRAKNGLPQEQLVGCDASAQTILDSFTSIFEVGATSNENANVIIDEYLNFVDENDYGLSEQESDMLNAGLEVAGSSYEYWTQQNERP